MTGTAPSSTSTDILRIEDLRVESVSGQVLVDGVSLDLKRGEVLGLIGESGAGKSTIGLSALCFARAGCRITGGRIALDGIELRGLSVDDRRSLRGRRVAYIAQSAAAAFDPNMTIMDQVCEGPLVHGLMTRVEAEKQAVELFRALDLPAPESFGARYPHQVSGGQLQRAMAAMAMACRPDVLVLDEPTTALDVTTQIEVLAELKKLIREHHTAALYITHDLAVVAQVADRIMVLRHGKTVEVGPTEKILGTPDTAYAKALVAERRAHDHVEVAPKAFFGEPILALDAVRSSYGPLTVVKDITLAVHRGETVAIVGESGSGKSSLARTVVGLLPRQAGAIRFDGEALSPALAGRTREQMRRIQFVYQLPDVALNPRQTIGEILGRPVALYFGRKRDVKARVAELLTLVGLPADFAKRRPGQLSGGQKQRVCIARALAAEPDVIICDEPTSALDPLVAEEILKLLGRLQSELDLAYLFITHDLGIVRRIAHRTLVMLKGEAVASGPTAEIFRPPWHPYTERLIASVPEMRTDWLDERLAARGDGLALAAP
ncbi:ABC transporter ATP-binding protein [Methyloraptor flagellatus]|uniref:ABC transporter ATP-binding protein n=1 Tax=Methyloraptor flagellatus TaxID=3162530 RepID=A0AAU7XDN5_9HYPH